MLKYNLNATTKTNYDIQTEVSLKFLVVAEID